MSSSTVTVFGTCAAILTALFIILWPVFIFFYVCLCVPPENNGATNSKISIPCGYLAYLTCTLFSVAFLLLALANDAITDEEQRVFSQAGIAFAILYCSCVSKVYTVQLTAVRFGNPSPEARAILESFTRTDTALFAVNLLGYEFQLLSTLFMGLSISDNDALKILQIIIGCFSIPNLVASYHPCWWNKACVEDNPEACVEEHSESTNILDNAAVQAGGLVAAILYAAMYTSICVLYVLHFHELDDK